MARTTRYFGPQSGSISGFKAAECAQCNKDKGPRPVVLDCVYLSFPSFFSLPLKYVLARFFLRDFHECFVHTCSRSGLQVPSGVLPSNSSKLANYADARGVGWQNCSASAQTITLLPSL